MIVVIRVVVIYKLWQAAMDLDWIHETWLSKMPPNCCRWENIYFPRSTHQMHAAPQRWWTLIYKMKFYSLKYSGKRSFPFSELPLMTMMVMVMPKTTYIVSIFHQAPRFSFRLSFNNCLLFICCELFFHSSCIRRSRILYNIGWYGFDYARGNVHKGRRTPTKRMNEQMNAKKHRERERVAENL